MNAPDAAHDDRVPVCLLPQLEARGPRFAIEERPGDDDAAALARACDAGQVRHALEPRRGGSA